jgi:hypothetical protein
MVICKKADNADAKKKQGRPCKRFYAFFFEAPVEVPAINVKRPRAIKKNESCFI